MDSNSRRSLVAAGETSKRSRHLGKKTTRGLPPATSTTPNRSRWAGFCHTPSSRCNLPLERQSRAYRCGANQPQTLPFRERDGRCPGPARDRPSRIGARAWDPLLFNETSSMVPVRGSGPAAGAPPCRTAPRSGAGIGCHRPRLQSVAGPAYGAARTCKMLDTRSASGSHGAQVPIELPQPDAR
jgi:hypothetical protein